MTARESRPSWATGPAPKADDPAKIDTTSLPVAPECSACLTLDQLDEMAAHADGAFVVVVQVHGRLDASERRYRRRVFLTAASAERCARQAQGRGHSATVYLAELRPVFRLAGGEPC